MRRFLSARAEPPTAEEVEPARNKLLAGFYRNIDSLEQPTDLEIQARQTKRVKDLGAKILAENCGKTVEQILKDFDRDYWMDANEAIKYGIVDKIVDKI